MIKNYYCILWSFLTSFVCHNETKNSLRSLMNVKTHLPMPQHWAIFGYYRRCTTHFDAYTTIKIRHSNSLIYLYYIIPFEDIHSKYSLFLHRMFRMNTYKVQVQSTNTKYKMNTKMSTTLMMSIFHAPTRCRYQIFFIYNGFGINSRELSFLYVLKWRKKLFKHH